MERTWTVDLIWIGLALLLVVANGFFVAAEFALVKVRRSRLAELVRAGRPLARSAQWLSKRLDRSLSACQLGITMASLGLGWIGEPAVAHLMEPLFKALGITSPTVIHGLAFAVAFTIITAAHLVIGEQAPKIFAIRRPEEMAVWCAVPLQIFYVLAFPALRALDAATSAILRAVGAGGSSHDESPHSEDEIRALLTHAHAHGELSPTEHRLVEAVFTFDDLVSRQIMVPRGEVVFLDIDAPLEESLHRARASLHTRYPVCRGSLDEVLGILHIKDLVGLAPGTEVDLRSLLRPPRYVPETMHVGRLLGHFQGTREHLALVVDEFGVVVGIVTLENVLEQIVGEVQDEFDVETPDVVPDGSGRYVIQGGAQIDAVSRALDLELGSSRVDTVAGLVMLSLGRMPEVGDRVAVEGVSLEVLEVRDNRATRVRLHRDQAETPV